jgi:hypothetical protein
MGTTYALPILITQSFTYEAWLRITAHAPACIEIVNKSVRHASVHHNCSVDANSSKLVQLYGVVGLEIPPLYTEPQNTVWF